MKAYLIFALSFLLTIGIVSSSGCFPSQRGVYVIKDKREKTNKKGWLGVSIQDVTHRLAQDEDLVSTSGAYVTDVVDNSPADDAGIEKGDVIIKFDGKNVDDSNDLTNLVRKTKPGTTVDLVIERDKQNKTLSVEIDKNKDASSYSYNFNDDGDFHFEMPSPPHVTPFPHVQVFSSNTSLHGIHAEDLTKQLADYFQVPNKKGVLVTEVRKNSDADKAGFKAGDVITKLGSSSIWSVDDLQDELKDADNGDELNFEIIRSGQSSSLKMKIDKDENDDDDDWSYYVPPQGSGHNYYYKFKRGTLQLRENAALLRQTAREQKSKLQELKRQMHENLREGLQSTKRELQRAKEELRRELNRI